MSNMIVGFLTESARLTLLAKEIPFTNGLRIEPNGFSRDGIFVPDWDVLGACMDHLGQENEVALRSLFFEAELVPATATDAYVPNFSGTASGVPKNGSQGWPQTKDPEHTSGAEYAIFLVSSISGPGVDCYLGP